MFPTRTAYLQLLRVGTNWGSSEARVPWPAQVYQKGEGPFPPPAKAGGFHGPIMVIIGSASELGAGNLLCMF